MRAFVAALLAVLLLPSSLAAFGQKPIVSEYAPAVISAPPDSLKVDAFYKKYADAVGIPRLAATHPDAAGREVQAARRLARRKGSSARLTVCARRPTGGGDRESFFP